MAEPFFDIERARKETRACDRIIHFNNAGAALMPAPVADALHEYLDFEEQLGGYETANLREEQLEHFYDAAARLLNCTRREIAFAENATRAWDMVFYSFRFAPGDRILTSLADYGSNVIAYLQQAKRYGAEVVFVPNDESGQIDVTALADLIDKRTKLIAISHIPTGGGLVNPVKEVGRLARAAGVPFLLDSCQGVGQIPLDVEEIGCDFLSGTGRKYLRGPRGTGLLYVRKNWIEKLEPPLLDQLAADLLSESEYRIRSDARRFENWECNFAGKAALGVAIDYALDWGLENIQRRIYALADELRDKLAALPGVTVTDQGQERCGIVTFMSDRKSPQEIRQMWEAEHINVTTPGGSGNRVSYDRRGLKQLVRASLHYYNTTEEIDRAVGLLEQLLRDG